jgi:hypothetical protein
MFLWKRIRFHESEATALGADKPARVYPAGRNRFGRGSRGDLHALRWKKIHKSGDPDLPVRNCKPLLLGL